VLQISLLLFYLLFVNWYLNLISFSIISLQGRNPELLTGRASPNGEKRSVQNTGHGSGSSRRVSRIFVGGDERKVSRGWIRRLHHRALLHCYVESVKFKYNYYLLRIRKQKFEVNVLWKYFWNTGKPSTTTTRTSQKVVDVQRLVQCMK
jgi:hypothetical protein